MIKGGTSPRIAGIARVAVAAVLLAAAIVVAVAAEAVTAQEPPPTPEPNPCQGPEAGELLCPDLVMAPPSGMHVSRSHGKVLLHATNNIRSRGDGPLEVRGRREGPRYMEAVQAIKRKGGGYRFFDNGGDLVFYFIPGQGRYWKYHQAARFEIWSLNGDQIGERIRTGPKLNYCFRDLRRTGTGGPHHRVYPGCSQDASIKKRTLGTSVGWSDIYPSSYHENWINVSGLRGCFLFVHRADPENSLHEINEQNNEGSKRVRLKGGRILSC